MITSRYLGSPPAPLRTLYCPLEEFSRRASYSTGRLATTPETDADLTEESGSNGLCLERQAGLPEGHPQSRRAGLEAVHAPAQQRPVFP